MIEEKELRKDYKVMKKEYKTALKELRKVSKRRCIDTLEKALMNVHDVRVNISLLEHILEVPYEKIFLPIS
jgi:hypothetical protein